MSKQAKCFRCGCSTTREWFCWGCKEYVCNACDINHDDYIENEDESGKHDVWHHFQCRCHNQPEPSEDFKAALSERALSR